MEDNELSTRVRKIIDRLQRSEIGSYVNASLNPPQPFRGEGKIRLIILGQDPTVRDPEHQRQLKMVLHLDQPGQLREYAERICRGFNIDLDENVYATNLLKNFFKVRPDTLRKTHPQFFRKASSYWIPLLKEEISEFKNVPVLTLGEPVLNSLMNAPDQVLIRYYWGFEAPGKYGRNFGYIKPTENLLSRVIFPFPHLPGLSHKIYRQQSSGYLGFIKRHFFSPGVEI